MRCPELLSPAGSMEGVRAAVQSGATAVYMGFGTFHARRGAKNFTPDEMAGAIAYCRARGVKTNITLNILVSDREREAALRDARFLYEAGADALIVQDVGLARLLHACAPSLALHASTQLTVSTLDGAREARELGFSRVVLARETPAREIRRITRESGVETEIFVHGALCRCYSGQCYLSAVIGRRSGNRGLCAQPCRLPYRYDGKGRERYPLSLKDLSLAHHIPEICEMGVASLKIEGRMKRPEYTAVVTAVYAALLRERRGPTPEEEDALRRVFSRDGFTDGYYTGQQGAEMLGTKTELPLEAVQPLYDEAARRFAEGKEAPLVPVDFTLCAEADAPLALTVSDGASTILAEGEPPARANHRPSTREQAEKALRKTGGTPFEARRVEVSLGEGLAVPASALNALRREALGGLLARREAPPSRPAWREPSAMTFAEASLQVDETGLLLHVWDGLRDGVTVFDTAPVPPGDADGGEAAARLAAVFGVPPERIFVRIAEGVGVPDARLEALEQQALAKYRALPEPCAERELILEGRTFAQVEAARAEVSPAGVYLPLTVLAGDVERTRKLAGQVQTAAVLPRVFFDSERGEITRMLEAVRRAGVTAALAGNLGQLRLLREQGMKIYGDFGLNAFQSETLAALAARGVRRQTLSFEMRLEQARGLRSPIETEMIVYGHLPLMLFEGCAIRQKTGGCACEKKPPTRLTDRMGQAFPLLPEFGCRNTLLNGVPLALPTEEVPRNVRFARLRFTIEPDAACGRIARAFAAGALPEAGGGTTRGLYRRGVE